jgi:hypothetical protein
MEKSKLILRSQDLNSWFVVLIFALCILNSIGCAMLPKKNKQMEGSSLLEPQAVFKFGDIPVPLGFKQLPKESYSFESSGVRVGVLKYQGKANIDQVVNFYKEQMLMYNWNLLNIVEYSERMLNFDRDTETCIISLQSKGNIVSITISIGPKSHIPKRSSKPVK